MNQLNQVLVGEETRKLDKKLIREMNEFLTERIESFFEYIEPVKEEKEISLIFFERFSRVRVDIIEKNGKGEIARWKRYSYLYLSKECMSWIGLSMKCISAILKGRYEVMKVKGPEKSSPRAWWVRKI